MTPHTRTAGQFWTGVAARTGRSYWGVFAYARRHQIKPRLLKHKKSKKKRELSAAQQSLLLQVQEQGRLVPRPDQWRVVQELVNKGLVKRTDPWWALAIVPVTIPERSPSAQDDP